MRVSPAFQITIRRYGAWQLAVALLIAAALATLAAWLWLLGEGRTVVEWSLAAASFAVVLAAAGGLRPRPVGLRWDGQTWWLARPPDSADDARAGSLEVLIDLSFWMLLRFVGTPPRRWTGRVWIALQRRGLENEWHSLRCAVYTSRVLAPSSDAPKVAS